jgi:predicted nucleotidyltransferase
MSIEKIQAFFQPMKDRLKGVYLYGTAFTEYERPGSDVDMAVLPYFDQQPDWQTLAQ